MTLIQEMIFWKGRANLEIGKVILVTDPLCFLSIKKLRFSTAIQLYFCTLTTLHNVKRYYFHCLCSQYKRRCELKVSSCHICYFAQKYEEVSNWSQSMHSHRFEDDWLSKTLCSRLHALLHNELDTSSIMICS